MRSSWLLPLLAACAPAFDTVDDACLDELEGADLLGDVPPDTLLRINCHRRYLGLWPLAVDGRMQGSAEAHAAYLAEHDALNPASTIFDARRLGLLAEREGLEGFTGASPYDRLVRTGAAAAGDPYAAAGSWGWPMLDAARPGDDWIAQPYARDALLQPGVVGVGLAHATVSGRRVAYLELLASIPSGQRTAAPIVSPRDGQTGVPTSYRDPDAGVGDPLARAEPFGFPVTVTVSTWELSNNDYDPFGIAVADPVLRPAGGEPVAVRVIEPAQNLPMPVRTTVILLPEAPLLPATRYEVALLVETKATTYTLATSFTTAADEGETDETDDTDTDPDTDDTDTDTDTDPDTDTDDTDPDTDDTDPDTDPPA